MAARFAAVALVVAAALGAAPTAGAHLRSGVVAEDFLASSAPLGPLANALSLRIYKTDRALALTVHPPHSVTVFGYLGEPFIRISNAGVYVDRSSPTAAAAGLVRDPTKWRPGHPSWRLYSRGETVLWHAPALRGLPAVVDRAAWRVPIAVDGRATALHGSIWRVPAPALWPWLAFAVPVALVALAFVAAFRRRLRFAVAAFGLLAAVATLTVIAAFTLTRTANGGRVYEGANELIFALVGLGVLARGRENARAFAATGLGLLALGVGLAKVPVLLHGVVLSSFPPTAARIAVAGAIWTGAAAAVLGLVVFFEILDEPSPAPARVRLDRAPGS